MGFAKRQLEERDALEGEATRLLLESGALSRCDIHEEVIDAQGGDAAEALKEIKDCLLYTSDAADE